MSDEQRLTRCDHFRYLAQEKYLLIDLSSVFEF